MIRFLVGRNYAETQWKLECPHLYLEVLQFGISTQQLHAVPDAQNHLH